MERVTKDPSEVDTWGFHWARTVPEDETTEPQGWLQGSTLTASVWAVEPAGGSLTLSNETNSTQETLVKVSGGDPGKQYRVKNTVTNSGGAVGVKSFLFTIANQ